MKDFETVDKYKEKISLNYLKGMCFNKGIDIYIAFSQGKQPFNLKDALKIVKKLYEEAKKQGYINW